MSDDIEAVRRWPDEAQPVIEELPPGWHAKRGTEYQPAIDAIDAAPGLLAMAQLHIRRLLSRIDELEADRDRWEASAIEREDERIALGARLTAAESRVAELEGHVELLLKRIARGIPSIQGLRPDVTACIGCYATGHAGHVDTHADDCPLVALVAALDTETPTQEAPGWVCRGCGRRAPQGVPGGTPCCHGGCCGTWGVGCPHCHNSPRTPTEEGE